MRKSALRFRRPTHLMNDRYLRSPDSWSRGQAVITAAEQNNLGTTRKADLGLNAFPSPADLSGTPLTCNSDTRSPARLAKLCLGTLIQTSSEIDSIDAGLKHSIPFRA